MTDSPGGRARAITDDLPAPTRHHLVLAFASVLVAVSLLLPRPVNFAPLGAFGLFAGAYAGGGPGRTPSPH